MSKHRCSPKIVEFFAPSNLFVCHTNTMVTASNSSTSITTALSLESQISWSHNKDNYATKCICLCFLYRQDSCPIPNAKLLLRSIPQTPEKVPQSNWTLRVLTIPSTRPSVRNVTVFWQHALNRLFSPRCVCDMLIGRAQRSQRYSTICGFFELKLAVWIIYFLD